MADTENSIQEIGIPTITMTVDPSDEVQWPVDKTLSISEEAADAKATGDAINNVAADVADLMADVGAIQAWTGEDIPLNSSAGSTSIADAFLDVIGTTYPVGSIIMTASSDAPSFSGTWVEVGITATWAQLKSGKRDYAELEDGETGGTVHFWLRTE